MFSLSNTPIDTEALKRLVNTPEAGAYVAFEGWVRENNEGKKVTALEYEAYEELAVKEGQKILDEAKKFHILKAHCVHRTGPLKIGDLAVMVVVSSAHRKEAFVACEFIINEIKKRVPIWKRESYADGSTSWVNCAHGHDSTETDRHEYADNHTHDHEETKKRDQAKEGVRS